MQNNDLNETRPTPISEEPQKTSKKRLPGVLTGVFAFFFLVLVLLVAGYGGYQKGIGDRLVLETTRRADELAHQYELGVADFEAGLYDRARQRFEYILQINPNDGQVIEMLAQVLSVVNATVTPTVHLPSPTPTLTPTPDLRSAEEKLQQARDYMAAEQWRSAIETLLALRKADPTYQAVTIDSMLYVSYRNLGVYKVLVLGQLESGLYDFSQAELFGPLDVEARNYRDWARFYQIGASFWSVDWGQAAYYFGQLAYSVPNLQDGNNWTAGARYQEALQKYIEQLVAAQDWCGAQTQTQALLDFTGGEEIQPTLTWMGDNCTSGSPVGGDNNPPPATTPTPGETPTPTPTPTPTNTDTGAGEPYPPPPTETPSS